MITTLENLPNVYKENNTRKMASWIIKYQNFATKAALKYAPEGYTPLSLQNYFTKGLSYMNKNIKATGYSCKCINEEAAINQILKLIKEVEK